MFALRVVFLLFMTWLLAVFLPGHQRGSITMGPREVDSCCAPAPAPIPTSCCETDGGEPVSDESDSPEPSQKDIDSCAVCHWAAGLLSTPHFIMDTSHAERAFECARHYHAQVQRVGCRLNQYGRDPPSHLPGSIVV